MKRGIWTALFVLYVGALFGQVDSVTVVDPNDLASIGTDSVTDAFINIPVKGSGTTFYAVEPSQLQGRITLGTVMIAADSTGNTTYLGKFNQAQNSMLRYYTDHTGKRIEINDPLGVDSAFTVASISNDTLFLNRHDGSQTFVVIPPGSVSYVGETNLMVNLGDGTGIYASKTDSTFQLKSLKNTDGTISINSVGDTVVTLGTSLSAINYWTKTSNNLYYATDGIMINDFGYTVIDTSDILTIYGDTTGTNRTIHFRNQYNDTNGSMEFAGGTSTYGAYFNGPGIRFATGANAGILASSVSKTGNAFLQISNASSSGSGIHSSGYEGNVFGVDLTGSADFPNEPAVTIIPRFGSAVDVSGVKPLLQIASFGTNALTTPSRVQTNGGLAFDWRYSQKVVADDTIVTRIVPIVVDSTNTEVQFWNQQDDALTKTLTLEEDGGATFHQINSGTATTNAAFTSGNELVKAQESWGTTTDTTDGNGELAIAHGLSITPTWASVTVWDAGSSAGYVANVVSIDATNITIRVFDTSNADVASTSVKVSWEAKE